MFAAEVAKHPLSGRVWPRQGTEICNFGAPSPLDFWNFSSGFFPFSGFTEKFSKEIAPKCGEENCPIPGRRKKRRILSRLWPSWVFRPPTLWKWHDSSAKEAPDLVFVVCQFCLSLFILGWCPSTVRCVSPVLVFQLGKQQNRTRTNSSTVLVAPPNRTRTKRFPLEELWGSCFLSWVLNWESTENWDFHRLEPYTKPYSDTSWYSLGFLFFVGLKQTWHRMMRCGRSCMYVCN